MLRSSWGDRVRRRVDIIGAGISGLATAYYLSRSVDNVEIHVWEKDPLPGGLAGSFTTADFSVEKFYHHIFRRDVALQNLIAELGLHEDLVWRPAMTGAYYFQQPYRLSSPLDLFRFKPLSLFDRLRLGWMVLGARRIKDWRALDDISAKEFVLKTAGQNVYQVVWEPLFRGKFGSQAEGVSAAWLWSKLVDRGGSRDRKGHELLGYLRGGLGRVFQELIERLRESGHAVHLGAAVRHLQGNQEKLESLVTDRGTFPADLVIGCTQVPDLRRILPQQAAQYQEALGKIDFLANVCLVLVLKKALSDFYWTNVTEPEAPFVGIIEQTKWADQKDFNGKHVAYISSYVPLHDQRLAMSPEELVTSYLPSIRKIFPDFTADQIVDRHLWHARYAQPIVHVGYRHHVPDITSSINNLFICTMAQIYPHDRQVSNGIEMALKTVDVVKSKLA
jgi:protoporphyrinogen oxidase